MAEQRLIGFRGFGDSRDGTTGHDQDVNRRLGFDVVKGYHVFIFEDEICGDLLGRDAFEEGLAHLGCEMDGSGNHDCAGAVAGRGVVIEALPQVVHDAVAQLLAARSPASGSQQLLDTTSKASAADHGRSLP